MTLKQQQPFSPYAFYVRIAVIVTSATPLSGAPLTARWPLMRTVPVRFPVAGLDATPTHIPTYRPLLPLPEDTLRSSLSIPVSAKTWCMRLSAVPATKCTSERSGRRSGDRFREHLRSTLTKREHPRNVWFFRAFSTHTLINFMNIFELLRCTVFSNFFYFGYLLEALLGGVGGGGSE